MPMAGVGNTSTPLSGSGPPPSQTQNTGSATPNNAAAAPVTAKTWELSDYELQRTPQEAITDSTEIAVSPRALHSELMCPICLDMLHQTMTTKECLHRFCAECIITALRSGNKECPTCRKKLVSKRSLRPDPNFDMLISNIYPSRDEYEAQQQKALQSLSKSHNQLALATSIEEGMKAQSQMRKIQKANAKSNPDGTESNTESNAPPQLPPQAGVPETAVPIAPVVVAGVVVPTSLPQNPSTTTASVVTNDRERTNVQSTPAAGAGVPAPPQGPSKPCPNNAPRPGTESERDNSSNTSVASDEVATEIELVFKPHPEMQTTSASTSTPSLLPTEHIQTRFIKTSGNATVDHLRKYLGMRLALDSEGGESEEGPLRNCTIWICPHGSFIKIPPGLTLGQICDKYWRFNKPLEVYYYWRKI